MGHSLLFSAVGYCAAAFAMRSVERLVYVLLAVAACVGALQLLGAHEWLYMWSRHGYLANGSVTPVAPVTSIFRGAYELMDINALQMRPSAIFASNQLFSGFIFFACAIVLLYRGPLPWLLTILLGVCAVVSAAKAVLLGIPLVALFSCLLVPSARFQAVRVLVSLTVCLAFYVFLFPGVSNATLNPLLFASSIVVRVLDFLSALTLSFGLQQHFGDFESAVLLAMDRYVSPATYGPIGSKNIEWASRVDMKIEGIDAGSMTLLAAAISHPIQSVVVVVFTVVVALFIGRAKPLERLRSDSIIIFALMLFAFVANVGALPLYWYWVGFGCYFIFCRAFKGAATAP